MGWRRRLSMPRAAAACCLSSASRRTQESYATNQGDKLHAPCSPEPRAHERLQRPPDAEKGRLSANYRGGEGQRTRMPVDEQNKRGGVGGGGGLRRVGGGGGGERWMGMRTRRWGPPVS
jgi:hypothetical protein